MSAILSACQTYRYALARSFAPLLPTRALLFVMLNPSTADADLDDPTVRRCIGFAKREGASMLAVVNLYALRATDPRDLWRHPNPVGENNDDHIRKYCGMADRVVVAWGTNARAGRVAGVWSILRQFDPVCLGTTKHGAPRHPLYVKADQPLIPWAPRETT